ncbi:MAG: DNA polymerase Y family protein, partial [Rhodospirillales bacterium]|nr:DNA polymerase Y family protein [Acetobacter sp.]
PDRLELLLARLRSIAGKKNVGSPRLENSHRDDAFTMQPFLPDLHASSETEDLKSRLAMRVFRPPQPARVICRDDQPQTLCWQEARFAVTSAAGPWHSSGSWWDGHAWDADLWDVVIAEPPQALRLRQEHATQAWFVVGLYD